MSEIATLPEVEASSASQTGVSRRSRVQGLVVVLAIAFLHFILSSLYYLRFAGQSHPVEQNQFRLLNAITAEFTSLMLLWYALSLQGRTWRDIGWRPAWLDPLRGAGVLLLAYGSALVGAFAFELIYYLVSGQYMHPRSMKGLFGFGITLLSVTFILLNPFFEEMIVRAYAMTEIVALGGSSTLAVILSVAIQMSYHLYQGFVNCLSLTLIFTVFAIYFAKTKRIAPIVFAHLFIDAYALIRGAF